MNVLFEVLAYEGSFEAELPDGKEDVIEELQADAAAETCFGGTPYAGSAAPHCRVTISTCASGCSQDVDKGVQCILALLPEELPSLLRSQECRVFLHGNVLQATVLALCEG